jgi:Flp pilus assembly protein TadB
MRSLNSREHISLAVILLLIMDFVAFDLFHRPFVYLVTQNLVLIGIILGPRYLDRRRRQHTQAKEHTASQERSE